MVCDRTGRAHCCSRHSWASCPGSLASWRTCGQTQQLFDNPNRGAAANHNVLINKLSMVEPQLGSPYLVVTCWAVKTPDVVTTSSFSCFSHLVPLRVITWPQLSTPHKKADAPPKCMTRRRTFTLIPCFRLRMERTVGGRVGSSPASARLYLQWAQRFVLTYLQG